MRCPSENGGGAEASDRTGRKLYREGTHRIDTPARTLARVRPHMAAMGITRIADLTGLDRLGIPVVGVFRPNSRSVSVAQGKGLDLDAAKASGLMEAVETFHAEMTGAARVATLEELQRHERVVDLSRLPRASTANIPPQQQLPWLEAEEWKSGEPLWVPYELVSTDYTLPFPSGVGYFQANTNGLASGNSVPEAVLHGVCELIERDATALWWQQSAEAKAARTIDLDSVTDKACRWVLDQYTKAGVRVVAWNTTTDIGIACCLCAVYDSDDRPLPELGAGCHPSRDIALLRALTEAAQARTTFISGSRDDLPRGHYTSDVASARLDKFFRLMDRRDAGIPVTNVPTFEADTIAEDLDHVIKRLAMAGMREIAIVNLTKEEFGIPVVRVIVPGLEGLFEDDYVPGLRARSLVREPR